MLRKVDLHTHSIASPDGSLRLADYRYMIEKRRLDAIAVTDHNTIDLALKLHAELGEVIIVGEEITTTQGEVIGLYLQAAIPPMLTFAETIRCIREQGGLVYVPHPFETVRKGVSREVLEANREQIDIIETYNGRAVFQNRSKAVSLWAERQHVLGAASSDAHGRAGWGRTYTLLSGMPTVSSLVPLLAQARYEVGFPGVHGIAYPKLNRLRKWDWSIGG
jgi:predicted metal-dependent phosphoesterase TrpH